MKKLNFVIILLIAQALFAGGLDRTYFGDYMIIGASTDLGKTWTASTTRIRISQNSITPAHGVPMKIDRMQRIDEPDGRAWYGIFFVGLNYYWVIEKDGKVILIQVMAGDREILRYSGVKK